MAEKEDPLRGSGPDPAARWARYLHDETLQGLAAARIAIDIALRDGDPADVRSHLEGAVVQIESEIENLRGLIAEMDEASEGSR